jgi:hypothetical protein
MMPPTIKNKFNVGSTPVRLVILVRVLPPVAAIIAAYSTIPA